MKICRTLVTAAVLSAALASTAGTAYAQDCQPGIGNAWNRHPNEYLLLWNTLSAQTGNLNTGLAQVTNQATYATYLAQARTIATSIANGRLVITLPDGTVLLDTSRPDDPNNTMAVGNSYQHFLTKTVNENHNSRVAFYGAQEYPCGLALEAKVSTSTGLFEVYLAIRLGAHTDSLGTARLSVTTS